MRGISSFIKRPKSYPVHGLLPTLIILTICALPMKGNLLAKKKPFVVGVHFATTAGVSSSEASNLANSLLKLVAGETGLELEFKKYPDQDDVQNAFVKDEIDAAMFFSQQLVSLKGRGLKYYPLAAFSVAGSDKRAFCLYHPKTFSMKKISDAAGKKLIKSEGNSIFDALMLRNFFFENGLDMPLWRIFKAFVVSPSSNSAFMAVTMGKGDFTWQGRDYDKVLKTTNPTVGGKLTHSFCTEEKFSRGLFILNRKTVPKDVFEKLTNVVKNLDAVMAGYAKKDMGIRQIKEYMKLGKVKLIPGSENEVDSEMELYEKAKKNNWLTEAKFIADIIDKAPKGQEFFIKPTIEICSSLCGAAKQKNQNCIVQCMK